MLKLEHLLIRQGAFSLCADWALKKGQKLALIGPSGEGKSTLLSVIAGFLRPAGGRVLIDGQDMAGCAPGARPVSLLFQDHNLFAHLTVAQNIGLGLRPDLKLRPQDHDALEASLVRVGLGGLAKRKPAELSGGQRQRVALARALLRKKPLLMLDEPFAALGPALREEMLTLVDEIVAATGATLVMVTHDPADARRIADLTSLVNQGVADQPKETGAFFANPPPALSAYLG